MPAIHNRHKKLLRTARIERVRSRLALCYPMMLDIDLAQLEFAHCEKPQREADSLAEALRAEGIVDIVAESLHLPPPRPILRWKQGDVIPPLNLRSAPPGYEGITCEKLSRSANARYDWLKPQLRKILLPTRATMALFGQDPYRLTSTQVSHDILVARAFTQYALCDPSRAARFRGEHSYKSAFRNAKVIDAVIVANTEIPIDPLSITANCEIGVESIGEYQAERIFQFFREFAVRKRLRAIDLW